MPAVRDRSIEASISSQQPPVRAGSPLPRGCDPTDRHTAPGRETVCLLPNVLLHVLGADFGGIDIALQRGVLPKEPCSLATWGLAQKASRHRRRRPPVCRPLGSSVRPSKALPADCK